MICIAWQVVVWLNTCLFSCLPGHTKIVLTEEELKVLRTECMGLSEILISGCDVQLIGLLAEGIIKIVS